ncbi:uncharacterized protein LOC118117588 [Hippoglossus stenolepis]|uniref:uncharacterized protein LOC118117588 n=1 Tax=Hippoglossus stenolepis TaxID=195615 RepID=UPI00178D75A8|nr:uncharacterized protein LOC118117588 [Hippoglossus stenolepis]
MDKKLLLAVLCLQVFLLITTFTSSDAATLETDDLRQLPPQRRPVRKGEGKNIKTTRKPRGCLNFHGGCGILPKPYNPLEKLEKIPRPAEKLQ